MIAFTYEEQGDRKYLVYEKKAEDSMDTLTLEMISNNQIQGIASSIYIQKDDKIYIKYDITGLKSFREYLQGRVSRRKLLNIIESIADAAIEAEDYMLKLSSYILDVDYIYLDEATMKVSMIVLPITREEISLEVFLKQLLMDVQYDQTEDCSYVAVLINFFSSSDLFSVYALKEKVIQFKNEKLEAKKIKEMKVEKNLEPKPQTESKAAFEKHRHENHIMPNSPEKQHCLDILFSDEDEKVSSKQKRGLFFKREKPEKDENEEKEKKGFFGRKSEKKKKGQDKIQARDSVLGGIAIPGMDILSRTRDDMEFKNRENQPQESANEQEIAVPAQNVGLNRMPVDTDDFGETEYMAEEEETAMLEQENSPGPEFTLYRCSTKEVFKITGEISRIGRSSAIAEICITGNKCVGRLHAFLHIRDGKVFIEDNRSKNKTYVDGIQLNPDEPACQLKHGAKIRLGDEELEFRIEE